VSVTGSEADVRPRRLLYSFRLAVLWPLLVAGAVAGAVLWNRLPRVFEESAAQNLEAALAQRGGKLALPGVDQVEDDMIGRLVVQNAPEG